MIQLLQSDDQQSIALHLNGTPSVGSASLTFTNQLSGYSKSLLALHIFQTGRATTYHVTTTAEEFPVGLYILTIEKSGVTYATRLCYIRGEEGILGDSTYYTYTAGDNTEDSVYYE